MTGCRRVCGVVLEGGTLTSSAAGPGRLVVLQSRARGWVEPGRGGRGVVGTLLGPEGTGDRCSSCQGPPGSRTVVVPRGGGGSGGGVGEGVWSFVENCTVDASIF